MAKNWLEDYIVGEVITGGGVTVTESMIIDFALRWDPQPFHIDVEAGKKNPAYGGLISSGWLTTLLVFRMMSQAGVLGEGSLGSPGLDEIRMGRPVRPGDTLAPSVAVIASRPSASKADRGVVTLEWRADNQRGERVASMRSTQLVLKRPS